MELGATSASQGAVSDWETGRSSPSADVVEAINMYCALAHADAGPGATPAVGAPWVGGLNDHQTSLIHRLERRLETGPPMSETDGRLMDGLLRIYGVAMPPHE